MGSSSKQVSSDVVGWNQGQSLLQARTMELPKTSSMKRRHQQNQQPQSELPLKCPRCDSSNTKFCYYNNYNKSQPRHFCKTCKRHWTKGGTLRNVSVGGGRKNKRLKTSAAAATTAAIKCSTTSSVNSRLNSFIAIQPQQQRKDHDRLPLADQKNKSDMKFKALSRPSSSLLQRNSVNCRNLKSEIFSSDNGVFLGSTITRGLQFPFPFSSSFETFPSAISTSLQPSSIYNYSGETVEDPAIIMPAISGTDSQTWQEPITSRGMGIPNYWNWDDIDELVSTDLHIPWDDSEIKP